MLAAVAWLSTPLLAGDLGRARAVTVLAVLTMSVGAVTFGVMQAVVRRQLEPMREVSDQLRTAALRPRDQITHLRGQIGRVDRGAVSEVTALVAALDQFSAKVEQRHARQTAWIVAVVHDVKTPIAGAANTLGVLARSPALGGTAEAQWLERVAGELRSLVTDVQRMVDAVRFEREDVELTRDEVDLRAVADGIAERLDGARGVSVQVRGTGALVGDRALLGRAIENLVANAVRYARSSVEVEVRQGLVRVSDDGEGLPAPLEVLAQPFRSEPRTVAGVTTEGGAGGIGLFLARRVLEMHGGRLVVESTSHQGTVFLAYVGSLVDG